MSEHPAAYTVIAPTPSAYLADLAGQARRLRESIARIEAVSTRLASQRRMALREADALTTAIRAAANGNPDAA